MSQRLIVKTVHNVTFAGEKVCSSQSRLLLQCDLESGIIIAVPREEVRQVISGGKILDDTGLEELYENQE